MPNEIKCEWCGCAEFDEAVEPENGLYKVKCRECDATYMASLTPINFALPSEEPIFWRGNTDFDEPLSEDAEMDQYLRDIEDYDLE